MLRKFSAILISLSCTTSLSHAQTGVGVSPPRAELQMAAGGQITQEIEVDNPGNSTSLRVTTSLSDALFNPDGSVLYLEPGSHPNSLSNWLAINPLQFVLDPAGEEAVQYTVQAPADTKTGTYWTVLFFESEPANGEATQAEGGIGITSRVRVGHIIYVDIGQVTRQGEIIGVRYQETAGSENSGEVRVNFRNTGNGLARVQGKVEIRDTAGKLIQTLTVEDTPCFPGYSREVVVPLTKPLPPGNYIALAVLDYGEASVAAGEGNFQLP